MKKVLLIFVSFLILYSCSQDENPITNKKIIVPDPPKYTLTGISFTFLASEPIVDVDHNGLTPIQFASTTINSTIYNEVVDYFKTVTGSTETPICLGLYLNNLISNSTDISSSNIVGFSAYIRNNSILSHKLYEYQNGVNGFVEIEELNCQVPNINANELAFTAAYLITSLRGQQGTIITIEKDTILNEPDSCISFYFSNAFSYLRSCSIFIADIDRTPGGGGGYNPRPECDYVIKECLVGNYMGAFCRKSLGDHGPWGCGEIYRDPPNCPSSAYQTYLKYNDTTFTISELDSAYNDSILYDFRDNHLYESHFGRKYVEYYYHLGYFFNNQISVPLSLKIETTWVLFEFHQAIIKIRNPLIYGNQLVINNSLKIDLLNLIVDYKALSSDVHYNAIWDDINYDVNYLASKTVNEYLDIVIPE